MKLAQMKGRRFATIASKLISDASFCPRPRSYVNFCIDRRYLNLRGCMKTSIPTVDLLEKAHAFPCPYLFKIIGKANEDFLARVVAVVREELTIESDPPFRVREAVGGRHISITLEPVVQSAQQVVTIYRRLGLLDGLVMMF